MSDLETKLPNSKPKLVELQNLKFIQREDHDLLVLKGELLHSGFNICKNQILKRLRSPKHLIINCACIDQMDKKWSDFINFLSTLCTSYEHKCSLIYMPPKIKNEMKNDLDIKKLNFLPSMLISMEELREYDDKGITQTNMKGFLYATLFNLYKTSGFRYIKAKYFQKPLDHFLTEIVSFVKIDMNGYSFLLSIGYEEEELFNYLTISLKQEIEEMGPDVKIALVKLINDIFNHCLEFKPSLQMGKVDVSRVITEDYFSELFIEHGKDKIFLKEARQFVVPLEGEYGKFYIAIYFPPDFEIQKQFCA